MGGGIRSAAALAVVVLFIGCLSDAETSQTDPALPSPGTPPGSEEWPGTLGRSACVPIDIGSCAGLGLGGDDSYHEVAGNISHAQMTLTWDPVMPALGTLQLRARLLTDCDAETCTIATEDGVEGASPLVLQIENGGDVADMLAVGVFPGNSCFQDDTVRMCLSSQEQPFNVNITYS
ncbi:MAG TPA: hypothetical protein VM370_10215 [Candidatus Thermoplasmatota archaeon]|nr:hypothetical protein [Candidatus Thermoplasmatota archaeon]